MLVLKEMDSYDHQQIVFARDSKVGLKAIIAIHNTVMGPALGGCRIWNYDNEESALFDVLRLSRGMSLKNAGAHLAIGGGKSVIIGEAKQIKNQALLNAFGKVVNSLGGIYYTAEDVNTGTQDIEWIKETTPYVAGTHAISGNPSPFTALGVYMGMKAGAKSKFGTDDLKGQVVAIQGLGNVGYALAEYAKKEGASLKVFDLNKEAVKRAVIELGATAVSAEEILTTECDIFAPCALGAVLNTENVGELKAKLICGAANNVLLDAATGQALNDLGILYCPDYIVNAGGVINCAPEVVGTYNKDEVLAQVKRIYQTTQDIIALAKSKNISTYAAADEYAWGIIRAKEAQQA